MLARMQHVDTVLLAAVVLISLARLPLVNARCNGLKSYDITLRFDWSTSTDRAFPPAEESEPIGFTRLLCVTHGPAYTLWQPGQLLSSPMVKLIQSGRQPEAVDELKATIERENRGRSVWRVALAGAEFVDHDAETKVVIEANGPNFVNLTCVSKVWPALDWFIGVAKLALCNATVFTETPKLRLFGYDGGRYRVQEYRAANSPPPEEPPIKVQRLRGIAPDGYGWFSANLTSQSDKPDASAEGNAPACFPADEHVLMHDGSSRPMRQLRPGDSLASGLAARSSALFTFSHRDPYTRAAFIRISFTSASLHASTAVRHIRLSPGHLIFSKLAYEPRFRLLPAHDVTSRHVLLRADGSAASVVAVAVTHAVGLFNPHLSDGSLVVSGVVVSCYTTAVRPVPASVALAPLRALHAVFGRSKFTTALELVFPIARSLFRVVT